MKSHEGMKVHVHMFLSSAIHGREWPASWWSRFTPGECSGWYGLSAPEQVSDVTAKRKILLRARNQTLVAQPITSNYNERAEAALINWCLIRTFSDSGLETSMTRPLWGLLGEAATLVGLSALLSHINPNASERLRNWKLFEHFKRRILWFFEDFALHMKNFSNAWTNYILLHVPLHFNSWEKLRSLVPYCKFWGSQGSEYKRHDAV
jgi:hypothetical protein